ncbi:bifunctional AP-4-A phosphorylase/ADP sulfurylase [Coemansia sp. Benny D115]|nr:bifunctional AP-4-A phosphorylase/ADP sulfurylase [Coemansia sp. Benny D115]
MSKTKLDKLIETRYVEAISQGALLFTNSTVTLHEEQGVDFEVRYVPALAKKPSSKPREKQMTKDFVNPFLPYDPKLHVCSVGDSHELLFNKYCVVPHHLLITTKEFRQQGEPLSESDFKAILETTKNLSRPQIVFYNSGEESGASQPHKHLQVLPMPDYFVYPPAMGLWMRSKPELNRVCVSEDLPFAHFGVRIDPDTISATDLTFMYSMALDEMTSRYSKDTSYNMILTPHALMIFPRRVSSWSGISINSLGFAGLILCKTKDELELLNKVGFLSTLTNVGYPSSTAEKL